MQGKILLVDTFLFKPQITESKEGKLVAKGEFARANVPTANTRIYSSNIWEKSLRSVNETMKKRALYGELDHPEDGKTKLKRVSHIITDLKFNGDQVYGEAEIMDTPNGKILQEIVGSGAAVGVSSRGMGSVVKDRNGNEVVQEDYNFITFDFVVDPANATSWPGFERVKSENFSSVKENVKDSDKKVFKENGYNFLEEPMKISSLVDLKKNHPDVYNELMEHARNEMKDVFHNEAKEFLKDEKSKLEQRVESKLLSDPGVAGAKTVLESVVKQLRPYLLDEDAEKLLRSKQSELDKAVSDLRESEEAYRNMEEMFDKAISISKSLGLQLYFEKVMSKITDKGVVESVSDYVGDASSYKDHESLKECMAIAIKRVVKEDRAKEDIKNIVSEEIERERSEKQKFKNEVENLKRKNKALKEAAEKGVKIASDLAIKSYISEKLWNDPRGKRIKKVLENEDFTTKEEIDERIDELKERFPLSDRFKSIGEGIRNDIHSRRGIEDKVGQLKERENEGAKIFGIDLNEIRNISGC